MADVRSLLDRIEQARQRPEMFVRGKSLAELESQCTGWEGVLHAHGIDETGTGFNKRFRDWLRAEHGMSVARGWAEAIRRDRISDEEAWDRFFELLDQFAAN